MKSVAYHTVGHCVSGTCCHGMQSACVGPIYNLRLLGGCAQQTFNGRPMGSTML